MDATVLIIWMIVVGIFPFFLIKWFKKFRVPEIPNEWSKDEQVTVCTYHVYDVGLAITLLEGLGVLMLYCSIVLLMQGGFDGGTVLFLGACLFGTFGMVFVLIMKNGAIIFHNQGVIYRTMLGETFYYLDEEIINYYITYGKSGSIIMKTKGRTLWVNRNATNYEDAKK